ncbi:hypothetical protein B0H15DRAFT_801171 [Mycena belliarum]|uniref:Plastocyanin-like domain-containing protein n=1 Tax=Mycena belliarum TaxID=1033014 RepID=A0AAD6U381_9AGAR|nr:hypothetical protein B0H15DRAFT_801171 [Mycena belliae]
MSSLYHAVVPPSAVPASSKQANRRPLPDPPPVSAYPTSAHNRRASLGLGSLRTAPRPFLALKDSILGTPRAGSRPSACLLYPHSRAADPNWIFTIDGHGMKLIEAASVNTKPLDVDVIQICASLLPDYSTPPHPAQSPIRTVANGGTAGFDNGISAILRYVGVPIADPTTNITAAKNPILETNLHPLVATPVAGKAVADVVHNLAIALNFTSFSRAYPYCCRSSAARRPRTSPSRRAACTPSPRTASSSSAGVEIGEMGSGNGLDGDEGRASAARPSTGMDDEHVAAWSCLYQLSSAE